MKKLFIILCFLLILAGCDSIEDNSQEMPSDVVEDDEYLPQYDMQNEYIWPKIFAETDVTYYYSSGFYLYYYDKETGISGALCNKPECTHDTGKCNAYMPGSFGFFYYNNKIYWLTGENSKGAIYSVDIDGSNRQKVKVLESEITGHNMMTRIHREKIYTGVIAHEVTDGQTAYVLRITQEELDPEKTEKNVIFEKEYVDTGLNYWYNIYGNHFYLLITENHTDAEQPYSIMTLYEYSIEGGELQKLVQKEFVYESPFGFLVNEEGIIYILTNHWTGPEKDLTHLMRYNPEAEELEVCCEVLPAIEDLYPFILDNILVFTTGWDNPRYYCTDFDGNLIRTGTLPLLSSQSNVSVYPLKATSEYLILNLKPIDGFGGVDSIVKVPLNSDDPPEIIAPKQ